MSRSSSSTHQQSVDCIARRFLHDFTNDISRATLHEADQAAWWAGSLRGDKTHNTSTGNAVVEQQRQPLSHRSSNTNNIDQQQHDAENAPPPLYQGGNSYARRHSSTPQKKPPLPPPPAPPQQQQRVVLAADKKSSLTSRSSSSASAATPPAAAAATVATASSRAAAPQKQRRIDVEEMKRRNPEARERIAQFSAQVHGGCGARRTPVVTPYCTGARWQPDTRTVPVQDPLYALLHRRLAEEGFLDNFDEAEAQFRRRAAQQQASSRSQEQQRRDKELEWYVDVYRPKQRRQAVQEVEGDARREISEEELASRMRIKHKMGEALYALQLQQRKATERQLRQQREEQQRREEEARHLAEWLSRQQGIIAVQEAQRRKEIRREHDALLLNMYTAAQTERERQCKARLTQLTRLKNELAALLSSEGSRRGSILALEATSRAHMRQQFLTERAEMFGKQRSDLFAAAARARRDAAHSEAEGRAAMAAELAAGGAAMRETAALLRQEQFQRSRIAHEEDQELSRAKYQWLRAANTIVELSYRSSLELVADEAALGRLEIAEEAEEGMAIIRCMARDSVDTMFAGRVRICQRDEAARRDALLAEYLNFVMQVARREAVTVTMMANEAAVRYEISLVESADLQGIVHDSLMESAQLREALQRDTVIREEHQTASRLAVEAAILRDALAAEQKGYYARRMAQLEAEEHDMRRSSATAAVESVAQMVTDARAKIAEARRASEAKLLKEALKLTTNFVGIGLAERSAVSGAKDAKDFLQVESLVVDGPGMRAGLRLGDMVLEIGGIPVSSTLEMRSALKRSGFVSKNIDVLVRRFVPAAKSGAQFDDDDAENENDSVGVEHIVMDKAPVVPTLRPDGTFVDRRETLQLLVSTTDERFKQFPFWFDPNKTKRICLPLSSQ